jgi:hypothetical protein
MIAASLFKADNDEHSLRSQHDSGSEPESDISFDSESLGTGSDNSTDSIQVPDNLAQSYYNEIVSIVDKLFDISTLIRGASRNFRNSRAAVHVEKDAEGKDLLEEFKQIVALKIRGLYEKTPDGLVQRLTKAIGMRRQQFYYQRAHKRRLAGITTALLEEADVVPTPTPSSKAMTTREKSPVTQSQVPAPPKTMKSGTTMKTYDTVASEYLPEGERAKFSTIVNLAPSEKRLNENIFPDPPKKPYGKDFECNLCFLILPAKTRQIDLWRSVISLLSGIADLKLANTSFLIFGHTLAFPNVVLMMTNYSRLGKSGLRMNVNFTTTNGGVMLLTAIHQSEYFHQRMNSATIFSRVTLTRSRSCSYLS